MEDALILVYVFLFANHHIHLWGVKKGYHLPSKSSSHKSDRLVPIWRQLASCEYVCVRNGLKGELIDNNLIGRYGYYGKIRKHEDKCYKLCQEQLIHLTKYRGCQHSNIYIFWLLPQLHNHRLRILPAKIEQLKWERPLQFEK